MRLIDGDALKKSLANEFERFLDIYKVIDEQPTINQWIPVSERLPQDKEIVLICHEHIRSIDFVRNGEWQTYDNVDAWMPLPERYEGDGNE